MGRPAAAARTNLADGETNVNRLRVPQFGIVSLCLSTPAKASKTYLQPGAKAPAAGADDFHFVPDKETISIDRKSTRLNSSHVRISYAVFCLKKKNIQRLLL